VFVKNMCSTVGYKFDAFYRTENLNMCSPVVGNFFCCHGMFFFGGHFLEDRTSAASGFAVPEFVNVPCTCLNHGLNSVREQKNITCSSALENARDEWERCV
jgi:hypothetical protein